MNKRILWIAFSFLPFTMFAQEEAVTAAGKVVLLFPDNTWKYKATSADSVASDSTANAMATADSVTTATPKKNKPFNDAWTGFRGFLKPELKSITLPEQSEGTYEYRVKVNKEGFVKEVTTTLRGPNGQTEAVLRAAITKLKFLPNGSVVPPLTEGMIKIVVPSPSN